MSQRKRKSLRKYVSENAPPAPGGVGTLRLGDRGDGWSVIGGLADSHLGSKHERLDVLRDLYDLYAAEGVTDVYHGGNWIEGEARFNRHDIRVYGLDNQIDYFIQNYPQRDGITTHYVAGDDHEGWYQQRESINIGRHLENAARSAGREDLHYLGYVEADVALRRGRSSVVMRVMHGGGGSAHAYSYASQLIVGSYQGGEKPAVLLLGHYHKLDYCMPRNVHAVQLGCTQDQSIFMRKRKIEAHVGGAMLYLRQGKDASITDFVPRFRTYFDRGYYERRYE